MVHVNWLHSSVLVLVMVSGIALNGRALRAQPAAADDLAKKAGVTKGVCAVVGAPRAEQVIALAKGSELVLYVQAGSPADAQAIRQAADDAGLLGRRVFVDHAPAGRILLAGNLADAVIVVGASAPDEKEILRVLRPGGKVVVGGKELTKPAPAGTDCWSHPYHGPDNNPQSADTLARAPYLTQFLAEPLFSSQPEVTVAAGGRLFRAFGHMAFRANQNAMINKLFAFSAYNGTLLWRRELKKGFMIHRNTMVATADALYLADDESCKVIDAATGEIKGEIPAPPESAEGKAWKWMALEGGTLYALTGGREVEAPVTTSDLPGMWHWPWGMWPGYDYRDRKTAWGFGQTFAAIDLKTRKPLWTCRADDLVDGRAVCMSGVRIYYCVPGKFLACLNAATGKEIWRSTDAALLGAIGGDDKAQNPNFGFSTSAYMKCDGKRLLFAGPQRTKLVAASADGGKLLWSKPGGNYQLVLRADAVYAMGRPSSFKLDYATGDELGRFPNRANCTRATGGIDSVFTRAHEGTMRVEVATGAARHIAAMRPACQDGVIISDGLLHWGPWICGGCNLSLFGMMSLTPAGDFDFTARADEAKQLQASASSGPVKDFPVAQTDWPAFKGGPERGGLSKANVPARVERQWTFKCPQGALPTAPALAGGLVFLGDSDGRVLALSATDGKCLWKTHTGGAVNFPPEVHQGRAFVGSDDGWVYAFEAAAGGPLWRFRVAPAERKIPVYGEIASTWPVAGGVVAFDGTVFAAAGIVSHDGTHVCALDAATGKLRWHNGTSGVLDEPSGDGVSLCGNLSFSAGKLRFNGGTAYRGAVYDARTGACEAVKGGGQVVFQPRKLWLPPTDEIKVSAGTVYATSGPRGGTTLALYPPGATPPKPAGRPELQPPATKPVWSKQLADYRGSVLAGDVVLVLGRPASGETEKPAIQVAALKSADGAEVWSQALPAMPVHWGVAVDSNGRLVVCLEDGQVICFGGR